MKKCFLLAAIMFCGVAWAGSPKTFLNGERIDTDRYLINMNSIDSMKVITEKNQIIMKSAKAPIQYTSLTELLKGRSELRNIDPKAVYMINGKFYDDISQVMVDKTYKGLTIATSTIVKNKQIKPKYYWRKLVTVTLTNDKTPAPAN